MSNHQIHYSRKFYFDIKSGYWISTTLPRVRAHQWVWIQNNGKIPKGYHIHHINDDKSDNRIENLELIKASRHCGHHMKIKMLDLEFKKKCQKNMDRIRPLTKQWHQSEEGKAWHKYHALRINFGNGPLHDYECHQCLKPYQSKLIAENRTRFCSNACKSKWRRQNKIDDIDKICPVCQKSFRSSKYSRSKTCSRSCGKKLC